MTAKEREAYRRVWRRAQQDPSLERAPNYWEIAASKNLYVDARTARDPECRLLLRLVSETRNIMRENTILVAKAWPVIIREDGLCPSVAGACGSLFAPAYGERLRPDQCFALQGIPVEERPTEACPEDLYMLAEQASPLPVLGSVLWVVVGLLIAP